MLSLNGDINTGILIRTVHLRDGHGASIRSGATLLYDSVPAMEEHETRLKATGFFRALRRELRKPSRRAAARAQESNGVRLLLVDNDDCFIHTLANYARQTGAEVVTYRAGFPLELIDEIAPDLILISPGPGRPEDFGVPIWCATLPSGRSRCLACVSDCRESWRRSAASWACWIIPCTASRRPCGIEGRACFEGLPEQFQVGRYHSLYAMRTMLPACLEVTAEIRGRRHHGRAPSRLPIEAVQFHPESILTLDNGCGLKLMENMVRLYGRMRVTAAGKP